uniref:Branched-chain amino acid ABC transporter permease n=1 Tax=Desulfatirhabdium butyrativorans TaxID=340467 RepID=A0A7C4MM56_9BACT
MTASVPNALSSGTLASIRRGMHAALPICMGYLPIGIAFGVLAQKAGLSMIQIGLMSLMVFAGSAQFIAVSMMQDAAAGISIVVTTFIVNLRHLLMSSSLAAVMPPTGIAKLSLFAYGITDESFALNHPRFIDGDWDIRSALALNHTANAAWVLSTMIGGYGGRMIPDRAFGLDYAMTAMFICLLVYQMRGKWYVATALIAGVTSTLMSLWFEGNVHVLAASVIGATTGYVLQRTSLRKAAATQSSHPSTSKDDA